jgi:hypothetical protein
VAGLQWDVPAEPGVPGADRGHGLPHPSGGPSHGTGALAGQTAWAAGIAYVVVIVGVGFSAGGAGLWALHHDADLQTVLSVNNVRNFAYFAAIESVAPSVAG